MGAGTVWSACADRTTTRLTDTPHATHGCDDDSAIAEGSCEASLAKYDAPTVTYPVEPWDAPSTVLYPVAPDDTDTDPPLTRIALAAEKYSTSGGLGWVIDGASGAALVPVADCAAAAPADPSEYARALMRPLDSDRVRVLLPLGADG